MRSNDEGLMEKYIVHKAKTGETVNNCFVLRPDRDAAAVAAIRAYAAVTKNRTLAADLIQWVGPEPNDPLTLEQLREMEGEPVWLIWAGHSQTGWALVRVWSKPENVIYLAYNNGVTDIAEFVLNNGGEIYRRKPEEVTA